MTFEENVKATLKPGAELTFKECADLMDRELLGAIERVERAFTNDSGELKIDSDLMLILNVARCTLYRKADQSPHLIAAATDLLDALAMMVDQYGGENRTNYALDAARAALAKVQS